MARPFAILVAVAVTAAVVMLAAGTAGPREDLKPFAHWVLDPSSVKDGKVADRAGSLTGTVTGKPAVTADGIELVGLEDGVVIQSSVTPTAAFLPKEAFTVVAWVRIDAPGEWGGILGCLQDNGPREKGFLLGFNKTAFTFALATRGADDGDGKLTYLTGKTAYQLGRWYHVAAVYDGRRMRLFVNGALDGTSEEQSGPVLYADRAPLVIGHYKDDDEDHALTGAIREVLWCDRAVDDQQIAAHFAADRALAETVPTAGPAFVVEPYLQYGTRTSMTVMCETAEPTACVVEYGPTFPPQLSMSLPVNSLHEARLTNLTPRTKYFYRVVCSTEDGRRRASKYLTFMTAVDPGGAWSFATIGDTQKNPKVTGQVAKLMWERRPHFALHVGDVVDNGPDKKEWTDELFRPCNDLFGRVCVYPTIGNHEQNHAHYYRYFSLPAPEYYYQFRYANADFFAIDTNKPVGPGTEQYRWLDRALAASDAKWKFCFHHHPVYSSDENDYGNTWKGQSYEGDKNARHLAALYEKHNIDICFNGHIHLYERSWPIRNGKVDRKSGVVYLTTGGGGGRLEDFGPTPTFFKAECRSDFHFCYITVHQGVLHLKAFDKDGRLFDTMTINKE